MKTPPPSEARTVTVRTVPIELSQFLKFGGLAETGGAAKQAITDGRVTVNGEVERRKGRKLQPGDFVSFAGKTIVVLLA